MTKFDRNYPKTTDKYDTYHKNRKKLRATRETSIFTGGQVNICRKGGGACYSFRCKIYTPGKSTIITVALSLHLKITRFNVDCDRILQG